MAGLLIDDDELTITPNGFSTRRRYIRQVSDPDDATSHMAEGATIHITRPTGLSATNGAVNWMFECGPLIVRGWTFGAIDNFPPIPAPGSTASKAIDI